MAKATLSACTFSMSGCAITSCLFTPYLRSSFYVKSPNARDRFRFAFTRFSDTQPPALSMRSFSSLFSGLWS